MPHMHRIRAVGPALAEVVRACCELPAKLKTHTPDEPTVHVSRRALKRARAVLRLGEAIGVTRAKRARRRLTRRARELSPLRDATVAVKIEKRLAARFHDAEETSAGKVIATPPGRPGAGSWAAWKRKLRLEVRRLDELEWDESTPHKVKGALRGSVRRVCRRAQEARRSHDIAKAHRWRKAVIVLREQVFVVRPLLGSGAASVCEPLQELAHHLGRAMDYQVFLTAAQHRGLSGDLKKKRSRLVAVGRKKRKRSLRKARKFWPQVKRALRKDFA